MLVVEDSLHHSTNTASERMRISYNGSVGFNRSLTGSPNSHIAGDYKTVTQNVAMKDWCSNHSQPHQQVMFILVYFISLGIFMMADNAVTCLNQKLNLTLLMMKEFV